MYSVGPATVVLVEYKHGGMVIRTGKDLKDLVRDVLQNSGDEFAFWAEQEAAKAAKVWREAYAQLAADNSSVKELLKAILLLSSMPEVLKLCDEKETADIVLCHTDFGHSEHELMLFGVALKYAALCGKNITILGER